MPHSRWIEWRYVTGRNSFPPLAFSNLPARFAKPNSILLSTFIVCLKPIYWASSPARHTGSIRAGLVVHWTISQTSNLNRLTDENSELTLALGQFKTFGEHLVDLTAPDSALSHSLTNIEKISTSLSENNNIEITLQNTRASSEKLKTIVSDLGPAGQNIKEFSETIRTQPWRLIWPTTKKYPEEQRQAATTGQQTINVRKSTKARPSPTPTRRTSSR